MSRRSINCHPAALVVLLLLAFSLPLHLLRSLCRSVQFTVQHRDVCPVVSCSLYDIFKTISITHYLKVKMDDNVLPVFVSVTKISNEPQDGLY